jgi:hypothetical protein
VTHYRVPRRHEPLSSFTRVCGFHAWRKLGRNVKKGERGIRILAPIITKRR